VKRLLFLLPSAPEPPDSGARLRNRSLLRLAAERYSVETLVFGAPAPRRAATRALQQLRTTLPDVVERYASASFAARLRCAVAERDYVAVQAEGIEMAQYLSLVSPERRIYDAHNAEFLLQRRASQTATSLVGHVYSRLQWRRLERFERHVVRTSRLTLAVSEHDANQLMALTAGDADVRVVPSAIEVSAFPFRPPALGNGPNLLFLGKLDFRPNAEGLRWFIERVLPRVTEGMPQVRVFAVGDNPPTWLVRAGQHDPRIAVTGYVADERAYLQRCSVFLLPLHAGGGSRLKALVAMASGLPIVSTSLGMEGLDVEPDTHFLRADTVDDWAASVCRLLREPPLRVDVARRARALVEQRYDWRSIGPSLEAAYVGLDD
jgi:glycosyltransferase involved in cell wall biosynthesis